MSSTDSDLGDAVHFRLAARLISSTIFLATSGLLWSAALLASTQNLGVGPHFYVLVRFALSGVTLLFAVAFLVLGIVGMGRTLAQYRALDG